MSNNAINVRPTFRDTAGNVRANGLLYYYENNTVTLATIYSDEAQSVPQSNPYTLDAYGRIAGDVTYSGKLTVKATNFDGGLPTTDNNVETSAAANVAYLEQFETIASDPAALTMSVKAGNVMNGETLVAKAVQTTTAVVAPAANPRIDRVVINRLTGTYSIITGSEAASPTAPAITADNMPSAQVLLQTTSTVITDSMITDERVSGSVDHSNVNSTETLTNKTLTLPQINDTSADHQYIVAVSELAADRTVTLPLLAGSDEFTFNAHTQTLQNKTFDNTTTITVKDENFAVEDNADDSKALDFELSGSSASAVTTIAASSTVSRTLTLPDATDTLVGKATTDTLTNKTIGDTNTIAAQDDAFTVLDAGNPNASIAFNVGNTTGSTTIASTQTGEITLTLPDATVYMAGSSATTGGAGSAGAGNQYIELSINGVVYKLLHDGTV